MVHYVRIISLKWLIIVVVEFVEHCVSMYNIFIIILLLAIVLINSHCLQDYNNYDRA